MAGLFCRKCASILRVSALERSKIVLPKIHFPVAGHIQRSVPSVGYAKKAAKGGAKGAKAERLYDILEVNTDPEYLVNHCAGTNYLKEGSDVVLKPDEDYPDWLWSLDTGEPRPLEEIDPETPLYWRRLRKMHMKRNNRLAKGKKF